MLIQKYYPNKLELDFVPGITTWFVPATDGTTFASLSALIAAGKRPGPNSYTLAGVLQPGIDYSVGIGNLSLQSDNSTSPGSAIYTTYNQAIAPTSDVPAELAAQSSSSYYEDVGALWNVWVRMTSATDKIRITIRY